MTARISSVIRDSSVTVSLYLLTGKLAVWKMVVLTRTM